MTENNQKITWIKQFVKSSLSKILEWRFSLIINIEFLFSMHSLVPDDIEYFFIENRQNLEINKGKLGVSKFVKRIQRLFWAKVKIKQ